MLKLTHDEKTALTWILNICMEQYETSGGDIDYAGYGAESPRIISDIQRKIEEGE